MSSSEIDALLKWAMPRLGLRWAGFCRVKRQVQRRVGLRVRELRLPSVRAYADYLERTPSEWAVLESYCAITISRFYRDRDVFECIARDVLPAVARTRGPGDTLRVWSAGCASGEEPYSIALLWHLQLAAAFPDRELRVLATDRNPALLERAARACYRRSSLRELPSEWIERAFTKEGADRFCLVSELRQYVVFEAQDLRRVKSAEVFDVILCRNLAFSYFELSEQRAILRQLLARLPASGYLVLGLREHLPDEVAELRRVPGSEYVYQRAPA